MGILEQVLEMKKIGAPDEEIITNLREQGFSPKQIKDALEKSQIKEAVYRGEPAPEEELEPPVPRNTKALKSSYAQKSMEIGEPESYSPPQNSGYQYPPQESYESQQGFYQPENYSYPSQPADSSTTDTIIEVAEQVI